MKYATKTTVPVEKTKIEIEKVLTKYGATKFASGWGAGRAVIMFEAHNKRIRFVLMLPDPKEKAFTVDRSGFTRPISAASKAWEQACRSQWRALLLIIKAKLEAVESGITAFEEEFLAHIVLPNGDTFGQWATPQLATIARANEMPPLLTSGR